MTQSTVTAPAPRLPREQQQVAVVVPHTHWDREWYAPFEVMRFHLVRFLDELVDVLEHDPALPTFLLDGQAVMLEDYLEVRPEQRARVEALVASGRMRPGPFYVQPDELHVSGEALVRNLLIGCRVSRELGWSVREGYLPDTFGHVHQLPQVLRGFGIETFYAMRGTDLDVDEVGSEFWWEAPGGSRVLVQWLSESYSNAAVLTGDPHRTALHHGVLVGYDSLPELLERLGRRSTSGALLLLNGGDHLRVQTGVPAMVAQLDAGVGPELRLGGLEEFRAAQRGRPQPELVVTGELRSGRRHDVFDGIGSTRTPLKGLAERTEAHLSGVAERLDALATLAEGRSCAPSLRHAWRKLVVNHAHDSICGCSVDAVHAEMETRLTGVRQLSGAVAADALGRLAAASAAAAGAAPGDGAGAPGSVPLVVVNPSAFARTGGVEAAVVPDLAAPLGERRFGWLQGSGADWAAWALRAPDGTAVPFTVRTDDQVTVVDTLDRRKEVRYDRIAFTAQEVPPLAAAVYRLVPAPAGVDTGPPAELPVTVGAGHLDNGVVRVDVAADGGVAVTDLRTGVRTAGLLELLDDGDRGDEYGFGPLVGDVPVSSRSSAWEVGPAPGGGLLARATLPLARSLTPDRGARAAETVAVPVQLHLRLAPGEDRVDVELRVDNRAEDHRLRLRVDTGLRDARVHTESAFGLVERHGGPPGAAGWHEPPSGAVALRRFVAVESERAGLQVLTEGLHECALPAPGVVDVTLLRAVGWLARTDHPLRPHKVGPQLATPGAQCPGTQVFRLGLRPYAPQGPGPLYRAAERFALPLLAHAVQGAEPLPAPAPALGLALGHPDLVLSALKTAEDGDGVVVRLFNAGAGAVRTTVTTAVPLAGAVLCDLEERELPEEDAGGARVTRLDATAVDLDVPGGRILTLRLHPAGAWSPR